MSYDRRFVGLAGSRLICRIFRHSPVFRIGGDEFAVVLMGEDFKNRKALVRKFDSAKEATAVSAENAWEQVRIALGVAVYDPHVDSSVNDTARRADNTLLRLKCCQITRRFFVRARRRSAG